MKRKTIILCMLLALVALFGGCAKLEEMFGTSSDELPLTAGTTCGNIINGGFAVEHSDVLLVYYTGSSTYDYGSIITSDPETGETRLVFKEGGLYMNVLDGNLFYCREDGIYRTSLQTLDTACIYDGKAALLQLSGDALYFIADGCIDSITTDGQARSFAPIEGAVCLNVYSGALYYIDTATGYICTAGLDGSDAQVVYETPVDMFQTVDDVIYFIDSADGYIKRMLLTGESLETVVEYRCSGFNVNRQGIYYTRDVDGQSLCCNAGTDGHQENVITDIGESTWHRVCMWGDTAIVVSSEDINPLM